MYYIIKCVSRVSYVCIQNFLHIEFADIPAPERIQGKYGRYSIEAKIQALNRLLLGESNSCELDKYNFRNITGYRQTSLIVRNISRNSKWD